MKLLRRLLDSFTAAEWVLLFVAFVAFLLCALRILANAPGYTRFPLDAYYYFDMASSLAREGTMRVRFEQGLPNKFFPGYPLLLYVASAWAAPHISWPYVQVIIAGLVATLLYTGCRLWNISRAASIAAVILLLSNPIFTKWVAAPAAEPTAIAWLLAAVCAASRFTSDSKWYWAAATALLVGMATVTRPDAVYFVPALGAMLLARKRRPSFSHLLIYMVLAILPLTALLVTRYLAAGRFTYVGEFQSTLRGVDPGNQFAAKMVRIVRDPYTLHSQHWVNILLVAIQIFTYLAFIASAMFAMGRKQALLAWLALGFLVAHSFWYYTSERFNLLIVPIIWLMVALTLERLTRLGSGKVELTGARSSVFAILVFCFAVPLSLYCPPLIRHHQDQLVSDGAAPHRMAEIANEVPGIIWSSAGPDFAYFCRSRVQFDHNQPNFYRRTIEPAEFFAAKDVRWVVSHAGTANEWFQQNPEVSSATLSLRPRARDGFFTLYSVVRR